MRKKKRRKEGAGSERENSAVVVRHLPPVSRSLLEGEQYRYKFIEFLKEYGAHGVYAWYDKNDNLRYVGKAIDFGVRLEQHLKNQKKSKSWERMSLYGLSTNLDPREVESLILQIANPPGNKRGGKLKGSLQKKLKQFLKNELLSELTRAIASPKQKSGIKKVDKRLTTGKLKQLTQSNIARILNLSQGRVSQLISEDKKTWKALREHVETSGLRDKILHEIDLKSVKLKHKE